jgi:hypothetical protein
MTTPVPGARRVSPVPPQHGAWAFLGLPLAVAATVSPWTPLLLVLAVAWVAVYPASYFVLALAKDRTSRRPDPRRFRRPLAIWWSIAVPAGVVLLVARPWLLWIGLVYGASFLVNVWFARRHDERALLNDAVFIAQCTAMVVVTWAVAVGDGSLVPPALAGAPVRLWVLVLAVALLLTGSTLHVKSLIRERRNAAFGRLSRAFAVASLVASAGLAAWWGLPSGALLAVPFAWFVGRAYALRDRSPRPARIGMVELVGFVALVVAAAVGQQWSAS